MKKHCLLFFVFFGMVSNVSYAAKQCIFTEVMPGTLDKELYPNILKNKDIAKEFQELNTSIDMVLPSIPASKKNENYISALIEGVATDAMHNVFREGPIVSLNPDGSERCIVKENDINMIRSPFSMTGNRYLYLSSGTEYDYQVIAIDLTNCNVAWRSKTIPDSLGVNPVYEKDHIMVDKKIKYKLEDNCLPK
jgi:hypothetical protein